MSVVSVARLLSRGIASWLHFEQASNRSGLFGEKYLTLPIGQILSGRFGERVIAEYPHPVLAPLMEGKGRRPEVDFVLLEAKKRIAIAVESKWIGRTKPSIQSILWDVVRLEMIAEKEKAECFFVLGGRKRHLDQLFKNKIFAAAAKTRHPHPMMEFTHNETHKGSSISSGQPQSLDNEKDVQGLPRFQVPAFHYCQSKHSVPRALLSKSPSSLCLENRSCRKSQRVPTGQSELIPNHLGLLSHMLAKCLIGFRRGLGPTGPSGSRAAPWPYFGLSATSSWALTGQ